MIRLAVGIFIVLHGIVFLLYSGQSWRLFELQPGMVWPNGSWVFSRFIGDEATKMLAGTTYVLAAIGFMIGGTAILAGQDWWHPVVVGSAAFSAVLIFLFWDGSMQRWADKGGVGLLINLIILIVLIVLRWSPMEP